MTQTGNTDPVTHTQLLTITEAAYRLRTPVATLRNWRHLGIGPDSFRLGRRVVYLDDYDFRLGAAMTRGGAGDDHQQL